MTRVSQLSLLLQILINYNNMYLLLSIHDTAGIHTGISDGCQHSGPSYNILGTLCTSIHYR
jgi:hypothetical protein